LIESNGKLSFIEQLDINGKFTNEGQLIFYRAEDFIYTGNYTCGVTDLNDKSKEFGSPLEQRTNSCRIVEFNLHQTIPCTLNIKAMLPMSPITI
jgi:hypothetical protein